jgi:cellulose synthase/poly-beta-1,6-N-acetylglucosamine synthase-like glycosyltransferase
MRGPAAAADESGVPESGPSAVEVSVVLPAYNEERTIEETVGTTLSTLADFLPEGDFEVLVAEDGCEDATPEVADRLAAGDPRVRHFHSDERLGRGGALERAFAGGGEGPSAATPEDAARALCDQYLQ